MNKKVLVSILAMTSASTMTAWANANVKELKNGSLLDWGINDSEGTNLKLEDGVITSPVGTAISQKISLAPGTYKFKYDDGTRNVTVKINGQGIADNNEFTVEGDAIKEITIELSATEEGKEFVVGNPELTLMYDFNAARLVLEGQLRDAINKIVEGDDEATELSNKASEIANRLKLLVNDTEGAYQEYVVNEMWKGTAGCKFASEIEAVDKKADAQGANMSAYQTALDSIQAQQKALDAVNATLESYKELTNGTYDYTTGITAGKPEAIQDQINNYKKTADEAHKAGTADSLLTEKSNKAFTDAASKAITEFKGLVESAPKNHEAYLYIKERVAALKAQEEKALQEIYKALTDTLDVYEDSRKEAQNELNAILVQVVQIENNNGTEKDHQNSKALLDKNKVALGTDEVEGSFEQQIDSIQKKWTDNAKYWKKYYADAKTKVAAKQDSLAAKLAIPAIQEKHQEATDSIKALINALSALIEKDYAEHTIVNNGYKTQLAEIQNALDQLDKDAADDIANYNAYQALQSKIDDAQKHLDKAKEDVDSLTSGVEGIEYSTTGKYETTKGTLDQALQSIKDQIEKDFTEETCAGKTYDFDGFKTDVDEFVSDAKTARDNYVKIQQSLTDFGAQMIELNDTVTIKDVVISGTNPEETYGQRIKDLQDKIDNIDSTFVAAKLKTDSVYNKDLSTIAGTLSTVSTDLANFKKLVKENYGNDKEAYENELTKQAIETIISESNKVIAKAEADLGEIVLEGILNKDDVDSEETKGLSSRKTDLENQIKEQKTIVNKDYSNVENKSEVYERLYNAKVKIDSIKIDILQLQKDVAKSKADFQANEKTYTTLTGSLENLSDSIKNVRESYADENRKYEFEGEPGGIVTKLKASYDKLKDDIVESYNKQTVVEDSKDIVPEEGETKPGFDSRIKALTKAIADAQDLAEVCAANRAAYDETEAYWDSLYIKKAVNNARRDIKHNENWGTYEGARAYYRNLLTGYSNDNAQLKDSIWTVYEKERASVAKKEAFKESLDALLANVKAVPGLVTNNNQGYKEMCDTHAAILKTWTETYADINANDSSSMKQEYLDTLTAIKSDLTMAKASIEEHFNGGLYGLAESKELVADRAELQGISTKLSTLKSEQSEGYKKLIDADNLNRHNEFLDSLAITRTYWRKSVEIVEQYKSLKNESLREAAGAPATTASTALNKILSDLNKIQTDELAEYEKILGTEEADLFDKTESFKEKVTEQYNNIAGAMKALDDAVYGAAQGLLGDKLKTAEDACKDALAAIIDPIKGITEEDTQEAVLAAATDYTKAQGYVDEAKEANGVGKDFALKVETCLENLAKVDSLLASAKEQAADKEWELYYGKTSDTKTAQEDSLKEAFNLTEKERADYLEAYANAWKKDGKDMFTNLNEQAQEDDFFSRIADLKSSLNTYAGEATKVWEKAQKESENNFANEKAYDVKRKEIAGLKVQLEEAVNYAEAYASFYLESVQGYISDCKVKIATEKSELEKAYKNASSQNYVVDKDSTIAGKIKGLYYEAISTEQTWLNTQAVDLDGEYNNAYAKNPDAAQALEQTKIDLQKEIVDYKWADKDGTPTKDNEEIQSDLLKYESDIASLRSQLLEISAPGNEAAIIEGLNGKLDEVRTSYNKMQGLLEERGLSNEKLDAIGEDIAEIQGKIDASAAVDGQILLNQPAIEKAISEVKTELEGLTGEIDKLVAKYDANKAAHKKLSAQITEDRAELGAAETAIKKLTTIDQDKAANGISGISTDIYGEETKLDSLYNRMELTSGSTVKDFSDDIATLLKKYTYDENSNLIDTLQTAINDIQTKLLQASNVMNKAQLQNDVDTLQTSADNLQKYNNDAEDGKVTCDIDGQVIVEDSVDYVNVASPLINTRRGELNETLTALEKTIADKTYVVGDADGDGNVQVTDYMKVMKYVLGTETVDEGTVNFLRADANQDGKINNGDLVAVVNKILGIRTVDALEQVLATNSMESVGEVKMAAVEGVASKKIAIQLCSTNKYAACQMDVNIPAGVTVTSSSIEGLQNHSLYSAEQTDGTLRLVVSSLENAVMDTEGNATIYLEVEGNNAEAITVSNVTAADVAGATYNIVDKGEATGINGVVSNANSGSLKQRIYSVGGQMMDGVKKGINIIMNSDGTARKVLKK